MDIAQDILKKFPGFMGKAAGHPKPTSDFDKFADAQTIKLRMHYDMWKQRIRTASQHNTILSNGWAFSTMSGLACFEAFVRSDNNVKQIYFDKSGEIERTLDKIAESLPRHRRRLNGAIVYGYGNLLREAHVIEQAVSAQLLDIDRIYLLDCSLFYHLFAKSPINPLRQTIPDRAIKPILLDYFEGEACHNQLVFIRDSLKAFRPTLHLFLGNTFCNVDSASVRKIVDTTVRTGDIVVAEYANYTPAFLASTDADYANQLATRAAAELFAIEEGRVTTTCAVVPGQAKVLSISIPDDDMNQTLTFQSMLRRKFQPSELTDGTFSLVSSHHVLNGALNLDAFKRLNNTEV